MKNFIILSVLFSSALCSPAISQTIESKPLTLSQDRYEEFFDGDSITQIGSVLYDVNSDRVIGFVTSDTETSSSAISQRWLSTDPLARDYASLSPYCFAGNNPIAFLDPDGEKIVNADRFRRERWETTLITLQNIQGNAEKKYGSLTDREKFTGTKEQWNSVSRLKGRINEAQKEIVYYKQQEIKTDKIMTDWKRRSPNLYAKLDKIQNAVGEEVDMMLGAQELFEQSDDEHIGGKTIPDFAEKDGVIVPNSTFGLNTIIVYIEEDESDRLYYISEHGQYVENHEGGHFEYFCTNTKEYKKYYDAHIRKLNGGHNKDDQSGKKANEYGKKRDTAE